LSLNKEIKHDSYVKSVRSDVRLH